jgi:hypothetical protein
MQINKEGAWGFVNHSQMDSGSCAEDTADT